MKKLRKKFSDKVFLFISMLLLILFLAVVFYPIYFILIASVSSPFEVANGNVLFVWKDFNLGAYRKILSDGRIWNGFRNTLFYTAAGTLLNMILTVPAAFSLSRKELPHRKIIMLYFTFTVFFTGGLIPTYITINKMSLVNTVWVMIIPFSVNVIHLIIARTFFENSIPDELLDAACMDGCSDWGFLKKVALPLSKSMLAVIGLYYAVIHWNEYFNGLIYLKDSSLYPLQLHVRDMLLNSVVNSGAITNASGAMQTAEGMKYGIIVITSLPMLLLYPFVQKHFVKGVMIGAVKG